MRISWAVLGLAVAGCTSVRLVQRDQCWIRQTSRLGQLREELGPCRREPPAWSQDRLTRIVQECVAQADHRWQNLAAAAWARGERLPARPAEDASLAQCLEQVSRSVAGDNERLKERLSEVMGDRDAQAAEARRDREHFLSSWDKIAADLGEAAKRPMPPATATASAIGEGRSTSEGRSATERSTLARPTSQKPARAAAAPPAPNCAEGRPSAAGPASAKAEAARKEACAPARDGRAAPVEAEAVSPAPRPMPSNAASPPQPAGDSRP